MSTVPLSTPCVPNNSRANSRAAFYRNASDIILKDRPLPALHPDEIRLEVDACGICGTDLTALRDGNAQYQAFGHEIAGRIVDRGARVPGSAFPSNATVVLESSSACGTCEQCRNMEQEFCTQIRSFWPRNFLGFADEMLSPALCAVPYEGMDPSVACLAEPLGVALDMLRLSEVTPSSVVLVSGLGPIGLMALRLAKVAGASRVIATTYSRLKRRNELAMAFGADELIYEDRSPLRTRHLNPPPNRILVTAPPAAIPGLISAADKGAIITYIGIQYGSGAAITFDANEFHFKKLQLRASYAAPALLTPRAVDFLRRGVVDGPSLITHRFPLTAIGEACRTALEDKASCIKVVIVRE